MEITSFEPTLDRESAVERTRNLSLRRYTRQWLAERLGFESPTRADDVYVVYYPDYLAYTSLTIRRAIRGRSEMRILAGIDAVTESVGHVDVDIPDRQTVVVDPERIIPPEVSEEDAEGAWREWLFGYVSREHRAIEIPEYSLDELELVYTPYWIIDNGSLEASLAISDLTRRTARVEEIRVLEEFYRATAEE